MNSRRTQRKTKSRNWGPQRSSRRKSRKYASAYAIGPRHGGGVGKIALVLVLLLLAGSMWYVRGFLIGATKVVAQSFGTTHIQAGRTNIVVDNGDLSLVSINKKNPAVTIYTLPKDSYITNNTKLGRIKVGSVFALAETKQVGSGGGVLRQTAQNVFAVPIDGYIKVTDHQLSQTIKPDEIKEQVTKLTVLKTIFDSQELKHFVTTDISNGDLFKLWQLVRTARFDKVVAVTIGQQETLSKITLPDNSQVLSVSDESIAASIGDKLADPIIAPIELKAEVVNASGVPGMAQKMSQILENLGVRVVKVDSTDSLSEQSTITVTTSKRSKELTDRLLTLHKFTIIPESHTVTSLGDVVIVLGRDWGERQ